MKKLTLAMTILLLAAPGLAAAQQQPPVPPAPPVRGQMVRPGVAPRMQRRPPLRFQRQMLQGRFQGQLRGRFAPQWQGRGFAPRGQMQQPGMGAPGMMGGMMGQAPNLLGLRQQLNLTDEQVKKLDAIRIEARAANEKVMEQQRVEQRKLMEQQRAAREKLMADQRARQAAVQEQMKQVLTAEQQKKLEELRQRQPARRMPGGGNQP